MKELMLLYRYCNSVAVFEAYFDESGVPDDPLLTCVGGIMARQTTWVSISDKWERVLKKYGVTAYHATDCSNSKREYKGWSCEKRNSFVETLFKIIKGEGTLRSIGAVVHRETFDVVNKEYPNLGFTPIDPCSVSCIDVASKIALSNRHMSPIAISFAAGQKHRWLSFEGADRLINNLLFMDKFKIKQIAIMTPAGVIPFQVADLFVYTLYKYFKRGGPDNPNPPHYPFRQFYEYVASYGKYLSEAELREIYETYSPFLDGPDVKKH